MRNIYLFLLAVFSFLSLSQAANINCPSVINGPGKNMYYCGEQIDDENAVGCVKATNDSEARKGCEALSKKTGSQYKTYWRLNNPVYHLNAPSGIYICSKQPKKQHICEVKVGFNFSNGLCINPRTKQKSANSQADHRRGCGESNEESVLPVITEEEKKCAERGGTWSPGGREGGVYAPPVCFCDKDLKPDRLNLATNERCEKPTEPAPEPEKAKVAEMSTAEAVKQCAEKHLDTIRQCKEQGGEAAKICDRKTAEQNASMQQKTRFVNDIAQAVIGLRAGSGAVLQCAGASLLGQGTIALLKGLRENCDNEMAKCGSTCEAASKTFTEACGNLINTEHLHPSDPTPPDLYYLSQLDNEHKTVQSEAVASCTKLAEVNKEAIDQAIQSANKTQRDAAVCACKLSTAGPPPGVDDCDSLPGANACDGTNASLPGCPPPGSGFNCVVGSGDYASAKCQCLRDPTLGICRTADGKVPPSFAGIDVKTGKVAGVDFFPGDGGGSSGADFDLGSLTPEQKQAQEKKDDEEAPGFAASSGGGGGSAGGGSAGVGAGSPEGSAAAAEGGEKPDLGFFGQMKSTLGNLFGGGKGSKNNGGINGSGKKKGMPDVNGWRPRGLASTGCKSSQVRCKNETIWDIVNNRYDEKHGTFITKP